VAGRPPGVYGPEAGGPIPRRPGVGGTAPVATNRTVDRDPRAIVLVLSDDWDDAWVQVGGTAEVLDMPSPGAEEGLVEYSRSISGEHPDWSEYRTAIKRQATSLVRMSRSEVGERT
jgi:hypothetical protein